MSRDAVFQAGMDLDHGSTTQTEEAQSMCTDPKLGEEHKDFFCERDGVRYAVTHLLIDLIGAAPDQSDFRVSFLVLFKVIQHSFGLLFKPLHQRLGFLFTGRLPDAGFRDSLIEA